MKEHDKRIELLEKYVHTLKKYGYSRAEVYDAVQTIYGDSYGLPIGYAREVPLYEG